MTPKLVLLDCDGVIVDSEPVTNAAMSRNLARYGMNVTTQQCMDMFVGGTITGVGDMVRGMGYAIPDDWADQMYEEMFTALREGVDVFAGLFDFLDACDAQGIPVGVVSNGPMAKMEITLGPSGLWHRFQGRIWSAHTSGKPKPDPGMLLAAMERFGVAPVDTWMVDDSGSGLKAGIAAGVRTLAFVPEGQHLPDVDFDQRVRGFDELLHLLHQADDQKK